MSDYTEDKFVEVVKNEHKSIIQIYLQNLFSIAWSKLAALTRANKSQSTQTSKDYKQEEYQSDYTQQRYPYRPLTDCIDPSLYYAVFFSHRH